MNRKILFRGKRLDNGEWIVGDLNQIRDREIIYTWKRGCRQAHEVDPATTGQYTGLKDKKRRKIFEGDIVRTYYAGSERFGCPAQVVFHSGRFCVTFHNEYYWQDLEDGVKSFSKDKMVVGNIYDDPELLEESRSRLGRDLRPSFRLILHCIRRITKWK